MTYLGHPHQKFGHTTYSQHGEDLFLMNLCKLMGLEKPSYLDLGAYHPIHISNTALLYENGSRGVNIEANVLLVGEFHHQRPEDKTYNVAVGIEDKQAWFYLQHETSVLNSLVKETDKDHNIKWKTQTLVACMTLDCIVNEYCEGKFPDILLTDIEGMDSEVLSRTSFKRSKPKIIVTEIEQSESWRTIRMMEEKQFRFVCRIVSNMVFVDDIHYPKVV